MNKKVVLKLIEKNITISAAESCTGGMLAKEITSVSGASSIFGYGFVTYSNEAKMNLIGVEESALSSYGAVSREVATQMAKGARRVSKSDIAVSMTGIAGPTGGTKEKPVGLVWIALSSKNGEIAQKLNLKGSRKSIRKQTCKKVFELIDKEILEKY